MENEGPNPSWTTVKEYNKMYYENHADQRRAGFRQHWSERTALVANLKSVPCADCGGTFPPECMDLDHRDASTKFKPVSRMLSYSESRLREEIAKCDIICSNCHRIRTHKRMLS